jgi:type VI secretion system secreted protein Hcp
MAIYLKFGTIKGDVTAEGYKDWIECNSFQFGCGRGISTPVGRETNREASLPSVSEITVTKQADDSSAFLFQESLNGEGTEVKIHITKTGKTKPEPLVEYTLTATMISGYSISSGGDKPSESLSLNLTKIEMKWVAWSEAHKQASQTPVMYDLGTAKVG